MNFKPEVTLISAFNHKVLTNAENEARHKELRGELQVRGLNFKEVLGSYKGDVEKTFVVNTNEDKALTMVKVLACLYGQESILIVDQERKASLYDCNDGTITKLGRFCAVDALEASKLDNWTLDGTQYYTVK